MAEEFEPSTSFYKGLDGSSQFGQCISASGPTSQLHAKAVESHVLRTCAPRFEKSDRVRFSLEALGIGGTCAAFVDDDDSACGLNLRQLRLKGDFGDDNSSREFA